MQAEDPLFAGRLPLQHATPIPHTHVHTQSPAAAPGWATAIPTCCLVCVLTLSKPCPSGEGGASASSVLCLSFAVSVAHVQPSPLRDCCPLTPCFQPQRPWPGSCLESGILETGHPSCSPMGQDDGAEKANDRIYFLWKKKKRVGQKPCVFSYVLQLTFRNKLQAPGTGLPCMILRGDNGKGGRGSGPHSSSLN